MPETIAALNGLIACLRGAPPARPDWTAIIAVANRAWLTPALHLALARSPGSAIPDDVRAYLAFLHGRNLERNRRLHAQLHEALVALNRSGITPVLLRGAAFLHAAAGNRIGARMMSDLDILVAERDRAAARATLFELGYQSHPFEAFGRPQDVGVLEFCSPSPRIRAYISPESIEAHSEPVARDGASARVPSPTFRALHLILSDQLQEGDYWTGCLDLRHLHDLAILAEGPGIDWPLLAAAMPDRHGRNVLAAQLLTLKRLFGAAVPPELCRGAWPRLQAWRRMAQLRPLAGAPLRAAGLVALGLRRARTKDAPDWLGSPDLARRLEGALGETMKAVRGVYKHPRL